MSSVSAMSDREFEFMTQPRLENGARVVVRVSKVGGGTVGRAYDGRWMYRVRPVGSRSAVLAEGDDLNTGTPKTHREVVGLVLDFLDDEAAPQN